jgi:murein DD-endopeptidase MepM/ murein hydrolase activator NlpD
MANLQQTYSGDLTSALAGTIANKVLNAAGMSKAESERRETQGLEKAQPGSLFASALGHEFGGDLYNRTLGNFDSKKPISQTDRSSSKEARFKAKYAGIQGGPVRKAQDAMGEDDGSLSVKDEKTRQLTAKILGSNVEQKLNVVEFSVNQLGSEIKSLNSNLSQTNSLILDQNLMLGAKFDVLLEHFTANRKFQEEIVEEGKVQRREQELEKSKDLSSALKLKDIESSKGKSKSNLLQNLLGDLIRSYVGAKTKGLAQTLLGTLSDLGKKKVNWAGSAYRFLKSTLGIGGDIAGRDPLYASKAFDDKIPLKAFQRLRIADKRLKKFNKKRIGTAADILFNTVRQDTLADAVSSLDKLDPKSAKFLEDISLKSSGIDDIGDLADNKLLQDLADDIGTPVEELTESAAKISKADSARMNAKVQQEAAQNAMLGKKPRKVKKKATKGNTEAVIKRFKQKTSTPAGAKATNRAAKKLAGKAATKAGQKSLKLVPGVGAGISLVEAGFRFADGDIAGGLMSLGSAIPFVGWGFVAADIARDMGFDPLNTLPDQYETGTGLTRPGYGILHGTEAVISQSDRDNFSESMLRSYDNQISYLASSALSLAGNTGTNQEISSLVKKSGIAYDFVNIPYSSNIGNVQQASSVREPSRAIERLLRLRDRQIFNQYKKLQDPPEVDPLDPSNNKANNDMETPPPVQQIAQTNLSIPTGNTAITFSSEQGIDATGEPGVDFSFGDYKSNYSLFDGVVVETGKLYGSGYGNVVTIRSKDANGREFDAMYAHFGDGTIAVKVGQKVKANQYLGPVGWDEANGRPAPGAGNMTGPHTSLDFFEPNTKPGEVTGPFGGRGPIIEAIMQGGVPSTNGGGGGIGGPGMMGPQSPMSNADYYSLLAISALEDDDDQGRADVAQALYNRLEGHRAGSNYYQRNNTLKSHIVAKDQFQPTFYNKADWHRIVDMETAITALVMSKKGRARGWTRDYALQVLNETEKALLNPELQAEAARHVKGRTYFLGTSEQGNMKAGDVLRNPDDNFFSMWYDEDNPYGSKGVPPAAAIPPRMIAPDPGPLPPPPVTPPGNQWWDMLDLFPNQSKLNDMERISANMDEMEDGIPVQTVVINNTILQNNTNTHISSSKSFDNPVRRYQMAALGA